MIPIPTPDRPWIHISMDFITDLPLSNGFDSILVVVDYFTKMGHFLATNKTCTAFQLAELLIPNLFRLHGLPDKIVSDRGPQFVSKFWQRFCELAKIKRSLSTAFHPQTDGQTERLNQTLETMIRSYINFQQNDWQQILPILEFAYNNSVHESTGRSPFYANYGYHPRMDLLLNTSSVNPNAESRIENLNQIHSELKLLLENRKSIYKKYYDQHRSKEADFQIKDKVYLKATNFKTSRACKKLDFKYLGPFQISEKIGPINYKLQLPQHMRIHPVFHVSLLKPHYENTFAGRHPPKSLPIEIHNALEYEVEEILDYKLLRKKPYFYVKWLGYGQEESTWEPIENLSNCMGLVNRFLLDTGRPPWRGGDVTI